MNDSTDENMAGHYAANAGGSPAHGPCVLALETSGEACSVAVLGPAGASERHLVAPRQHTERIFAAIEEALASAGVERDALGLVAFGAGPGAFTGGRIAASIAQGIALARALPMVPVSSLRALAAGALRTSGASAVIAAIDARRGEVYSAAYLARGDDAIEVVPARVLAPASLAPPVLDAAWQRAGNGWLVYSGSLDPTCAALPYIAFDGPRAGDVARLALIDHAAGRAVDAHAALPVYLRGAVD